MTDIKPYITELLRDTAAVELSFYDGLRTLPVIVMSETTNEAEVILGNTERVSRIEIQLDVYAEEAAEVERVSLEASGILTSAGLVRSFSECLYDGNRPRRCMRFTCGIDEAEGRILKL